MQRWPPFIGPLPECLCGCGKMVTLAYCKRNSQIPNKYIMGHSNKGKKLSIDHRHKLSLSHRSKGRRFGADNPFFGKKHSAITLKRMSDALTGKTPSAQTRLKMSVAKRGSRHPHWQGGISYLPYTPDFNAIKKTTIRQRDRFCCQLCKAKESLDRKLSIHHIDYNKKNNLNDNLISLCISCHAKTNFNRDYWRSLFHEILETKPVPPQTLLFAL